MERTNLSRHESPHRLSFFSWCAATGASFLAVAWPFLTPLLLGAILASLSQPLYQAVTRLVGGRTSLGAFLTLLILFLLVAGSAQCFCRRGRGPGGQCE